MMFKRQPGDPSFFHAVSSSPKEYIHYPSTENQLKRDRPRGEGGAWPQGGGEATPNPHELMMMSADIRLP